MADTLYLCSAVALAGRLKTLGVDSIMVERNANVGDSWALRYDCMKFHIPTPACDMPYMGKNDARKTFDG